MSDRIELRVHHFIAEGRDESKSHVLLEIAQPAPNELSTHGHFFALAELSNATPKTIQMVRAWIEFAIEGYYKSVPTSIESHFETILNQLNMQSTLYLKQHAHESVHVAIAAVCHSNLYLAIHGQPAALLLYRKNDVWQWMDLVEQQEAGAQPAGQLFSNVVNGSMRVDDRFLLATPRVIEFFSADRLAKISDGKSIEEVNEHMGRILRGLSSEYSFAGVWLRHARSFDEAQEAAALGAATRGATQKADISMADLMNKTKSTATILAPPVLMIPKDKIITNILQLARRGIMSGAALTRTGIRYLISFVKKQRPAAITQAFAHRKPLALSLREKKSEFSARYRALPQRRKQVLLGASGVLLITLIAIGSIAFVNSNSSARQAETAQLELVNEKLRAADDLFTYQNEPAARAAFAEAETFFAALPRRARTSDDGETTAATLFEKRNKIFRIAAVSLSAVASTESLTATDVVAFNAQVAVLSGADLYSIKDGAKKIAEIPNARALYFDDSEKRFFVATSERSFTTISSDGKKISPTDIAWLPEDTQSAAVVFYAGRLYSFNAATHQLYRYESGGSGFANGSRWIKDGGKPTSVVALSVDTSLWLRTDAGAIMKYTAGKA